MHEVTFLGHKCTDKGITMRTALEDLLHSALLQTFY